MRYISTDNQINREVFFQNPSSIEKIMELKNFDPNGQVVSTRTGIKYPFIYFVYTHVIDSYRYRLVDQLLKKGINLNQPHDSQLSVLSYLISAALAEKDRHFFKLFLNHASQIPARRRELMQKQVMLSDGEIAQPLNDFINEILTLYPAKEVNIGSQEPLHKAVQSPSPLSNLLQWLRIGSSPNDNKSTTSLLKKTA
ncbi:MAG: hypothetical protein JSR33_06075 [Proteobacteria bacterium]|nr:hypothetical protein [Pseudomonadota bacterium]